MKYLLSVLFLMAAAPAIAEEKCDVPFIQREKFESPAKNKADFDKCPTYNDFTCGTSPWYPKKPLTVMKPFSFMQTADPMRYLIFSKEFPPMASDDAPAEATQGTHCRMIFKKDPKAAYREIKYDTGTPPIQVGKLYVHTPAIEPLKRTAMIRIDTPDDPAIARIECFTGKQMDRRFTYADLQAVLHDAIMVPCPNIEMVETSAVDNEASMKTDLTGTKKNPVKKPVPPNTGAH